MEAHPATWLQNLHIYFISFIKSFHANWVSEKLDNSLVLVLQRWCSLQVKAYSFYLQSSFLQTTMQTQYQQEQCINQGTSTTLQKSFTSHWISLPRMVPHTPSHSSNGTHWTMLRRSFYQLQQSSQQHDIRHQHFHFQAHPRYAASATQILAHPRFYQCIYIWNTVIGQSSLSNRWLMRV